MFRPTLLVAFAATLSAFASAQLNYSTSGNLTVNITQIDQSKKDSWCESQTHACPVICGGNQNVKYMTCNKTTLDWACTCNGSPQSQPNISAYNGTIPFFICGQWVANCAIWQSMQADAQDAVAGCRSVTCGGLDSTPNDTKPHTTSSSGMSPTSSPSTSDDPSDSDSTPTPTTGAALALHVAQNYGTGIMASGLFAIFGLFL